MDGGAETVSEGVVPDGHPVSLTGERSFEFLESEGANLRDAHRLKRAGRLVSGSGEQ